MDGLLTILGIGAMYLYFSRKNSEYAKVYEEMKDIIADEKDKNYELETRFEDELQSNDPEYIDDMIKRTLKASILFDYISSSSTKLNFELSFRNDSDNTYDIEEVTAYLTAGKWYARSFVPKDKDIQVLYPGYDYHLCPETNTRTGEAYYGYSGIMQDAAPEWSQISAWMKENGIEYKDGMTGVVYANIEIYVRLSGSNQKRKISYDDFPVSYTKRSSSSHR